MGVSVSANAADPTASATSLDWGYVPKDTDANKTVTLSNPNAYEVSFVATITNGGAYFKSVTDSCSSTLLANGSCTLTVVFNPGITTAQQAGTLEIIFGSAAVQNITATDGSVADAIRVSWDPVAEASGYDLQYRLAGSADSWNLLTDASTGQTITIADEQIYEFQVRSKNLDGGVSAWRPDPAETGFRALTCASGTLSWGGGCSAPVPSGTPGQTIASLINAASGYDGEASLVCQGETGLWEPVTSRCDTLLAPTDLQASDGSEAGLIVVNWTESAGATGYDIQYRKQGETDWQLMADASPGEAFVALDTDPYEFQVRAKNVAGPSAWSTIETGYAEEVQCAYLHETHDERRFEFRVGSVDEDSAQTVFTELDEGYIRKNIAPVYVSAQQVPLKIGVGQPLTITQTWQNKGSEAWQPGSVYGLKTIGEQQWAIGFSPFESGPISTGQSVTQTLNGMAPGIAGDYVFQTAFFKGSQVYGDPSEEKIIKVIDTPSCNALIPEITETYKKNQVIGVTIFDVQSTISAKIRVWSEENGEDDAQEYVATEEMPGVWKAFFPMTNHADFGKIQIEAIVNNEVFDPVTCRTTYITYQELPNPEISLQGTLGTFADGTRQGFVVDRESGQFALGTVDLGSFNNLKVNIEALDDYGNIIGSSQTNLPTRKANALVMSDLSGRTWETRQGSVRVTYADPDAAAQGKETLVPVTWMLSPMPMVVDLEFDTTEGLNATAILRESGYYDSDSHGDFTAWLELQESRSLAASERQVPQTGDAIFANLSYSSLYDQALIAVVRATPPSGVTLAAPIEYRSAANRVPLLPPRFVSATDGTRKNDVLITWQEVIPGSSIKYLVFRDGILISGTGAGIAATSLIDEPPERGQIYNYGVQAVLKGLYSEETPTDSGHVPHCRAAELINASLDAGMNHINGLVEQWFCLESVVATYAFDTGEYASLDIQGDDLYRNFSAPIPAAMTDGNHVLHVRLQSQGVAESLESDLIFDIPFTLNRASVTISGMSITYNGGDAVEGQESDSIGRFGVRFEGGTGIGFAEPVE